MQVFLNGLLRRLFKSRGQRSKGSYNSEHFLAVVPVLMLFAEEFRPTGRAFSGF